MQVIKIPFNKVPQFSSRDKAYVLGDGALRPFYKYPVSLEAFKQVMADKQKDPADRATLVEVLLRQHEGLEVPPVIYENIKKLRNKNSFTVITAHQPSLFTGPLYYIFKIMSVINLAEKLKEKYPENNFIPLFITSGEDHDFAEINHLHLFNKTLTWESGQTGPTGNMDTATLRPVLDELKNILGENENAKNIFSLIEKAYTENEKYDRAAYHFTYELFKRYGLVVLNTNDAELKKLFVPIIKEEIFHQVSKPLVESAFEELNKIGFAPQAVPREINFFYLKGHIRERIVFENNVYKILNTDISFSKKEMEKEIENHPEHFSPNVIMRPIYQELTTPNLAYIGGGGEIAYWLERKKQFEYFNINFPMLVRRDSAMWIDAGVLKKMKKNNLEINDLWKKTDVLIREYISNFGVVEISLKKEKKELEKIYEGLAKKAKAANPSLEKFVLAEHAKARKSLDQIETRLLRAEKQSNENAISQIRSVKEKLFPNNGLQERYDNFLPYYLKYGDAFFQILKECFDPLEKVFKVIVGK